MPRKAKEKVIENENINEETTEKKSTKKSASSTEKKATKKSTSSTEKKATKKSTSSVKKTTSSRKRIVTDKSEHKNLPIQILEYYDLPYKYGNTIVKLLAQTPKTLFVYWEISDNDIKLFKETYGENFFNITTPILIVHNLTLNKTSEIEINDFANCWYLNTEDANCKYDVELARKFIKPVSKSTQVQENDYLHIAKSNNLTSPNDHIMYEKLSNIVAFKNYKTNEVTKKNINSFSFLSNIHEFYKKMYKDELLKNPSSDFLN